MILTTLRLEIGSMSTSCLYLYLQLAYLKHLCHFGYEITKLQEISLKYKEIYNNSPLFDPRNHHRRYSTKAVRTHTVLNITFKSYNQSLTV